MSIAKRIPNGSVASLTHAGLRSRNEDRVLVVTFPERLGLPVLSLLAVADGVGGGEAGEVASEIAIQGLQERVNEFVYSALQESPDPSREELQRLLSNLLLRSFDELDQEIKEWGQSTAATTLTAAVLCKGFLVFGHVGDSRLYLANPSGLEQQTTDHKSGDDGAPRCLGTPHLTPEIGIRETSGDLLILLCSDGISGTLTEREINEALHSGSSVSEGVHSLVKEALASGAEDNCSVAVAVQGTYRAALPAIDSEKEARQTRLPSEVGNEAVSTPAAVALPSRRLGGASTAARVSWIPLAILGGMMFCLAALLWLLWPDLTAAIGWNKADEKARAVVADASADQNVERLRQRQVTQAQIIGTLQGELEQAEAEGVAGRQRARDLDKELAELKSEQRKTQSLLEDATEALERELSARKQMQTELSAVNEALEAQAESQRQREEQERQERLRLEKQLEAELVRCARSFYVVLGPGEGVPARQIFDASVRLLPLDTEAGEQLVVLVGANRGDSFEVLQAKKGTSEGDRPLEVFGRRQRSRYEKQLEANEKWTFFLLTGYGYARLGEPTDGTLVTANHDFLFTLPHLELTYEAR